MFAGSKKSPFFSKKTAYEFASDSDMMNTDKRNMRRRLL